MEWNRLRPPPQYFVEAFGMWARQKLMNHKYESEILLMRQRDKHSQSPQMQAAVKFDGAILRSSE
jgi:hypothetical protein